MWVWPSFTDGSLCSWCVGIQPNCPPRRSNGSLSMSLGVRSNFIVQHNFLPFLQKFSFFFSLVVVFWWGWEVRNANPQANTGSVTSCQGLMLLVGVSWCELGMAGRNEGKLNKMLTLHCAQMALSWQCPGQIHPGHHQTLGMRGALGRGIGRQEGLDNTCLLK